MSDEKVVDFEENKKKGGKIKKWAGNLKKKAVYATQCIFGEGPEDDQAGNYIGGIIAGACLFAFGTILGNIATSGCKKAAIKNAMASCYLKGQCDEAEKLLGDSTKNIIDDNSEE